MIDRMALNDEFAALLMKDGQPLDTLSMRSALEGFGQREQILDVVRRVIGNPDNLAAVASRSYRHANGFDKITLARVPNKYTVKLDVWWGIGMYSEHSRSIAREEPHNHVANFSSRILTGALRLRHFEMHPDGERRYHYRIGRLSPNVKGDVFVLQGEVRLRELYDGLVPAGASYTLHHDHYHVVESSPTEPTVTLVFQGRARKDYSEALLASQDMAISRPIHFFSPDQLRPRLQRLTDVLAQAPSQYRWCVGNFSDTRRSRSLELNEQNRDQ